MLNNRVVSVLKKLGVKYRFSYVKINSSVSDIPQSCGRESVAHRILKREAIKILKDKGEENPLVEYQWYDVYSPKLQIRVECGTIPLFRVVVDFLRLDMDCRELWLLSFPNEDYVAELEVLIKTDSEQLRKLRQEIIVSVEKMGESLA